MGKLCETSSDRAVISQAAAALANLACDEACRADLKKKFGWNNDYGSKRLAHVSKLNLQMQRKSTSSSLSRPASPFQSPAGSSSAASRAIHRRTSGVGARAARPASASASFARKKGDGKEERVEEDKDDDSESLYIGVSPLAQRECNRFVRSQVSTTILWHSSEPTRGVKSQGMRSRSLTPDPVAAFKRRGSRGGESSRS